MTLFRKILVLFFLLFPISNSFAAMVTYVHQAFVTEDAGDLEVIFKVFNLMSKERKCLRFIEVVRVMLQRLI